MWPSRTRLLTPGPVELHPRALEALARPQLHHRSEEAKALFHQARQGLTQAFQTQGEVLLITGSGTAAMDALVQNLFAPGQTVWVPVHGKFSERWAEIAQAAGLRVMRHDLDWGQSVTLADLQTIAGPPDGILLTHSETSTGAQNDLPALAAAIKQRFPNTLLVVDAITSLLLSPFALEGWGIDAAASGSQKGVMCPPGLGFAALSPRALQLLQPRGYYLNLAAELKVQKTGESAWTPAINLIAAVAGVLGAVLPHLEDYHRLKSQQTELLYQAGQRVGLRPVPAVPGPATTCFWLPDGLSYAQVKDGFARRGATIMGGQGHLKGRTFRLSLMGYSDLYDAYAVAQMIEDVFTELGK